MNYILHYDKLIHRAQTRTLPSDVYVETHHILPRCIGGNDTKGNLVELTAEEHLLAHILLTKIYPYEGLKLAARQMLLQSSGDCIGRSSFNKKYGYWRRKLQDSLKELKWWHNGVKSQRAKVCPGADWVPGMANDPWNKGIKTGPNLTQSNIMRGRAQPVKTIEARANSGHKGTCWWTTGTKNKRSTVSPGEGWAKGSCAESTGSAGMKWWNNGTANILSLICPEGYIKGRLSKTH